MPVKIYDPTTDQVIPVNTNVFLRKVQPTQVGPWESGTIVKHILLDSSEAGIIIAGTAGQPRGNQTELVTGLLDSGRRKDVEDTWDQKGFIARVNGGKLFAYSILKDNGFSESIVLTDGKVQIAYETHGFLQKWLTGTLDTALVDALSVSAGLSILVNNKGWDRGFAIASCLLALLGALSALRTGWRALNEKGFTSRRANLSLGGQSILNLVSAVMNFVAGAGSANLPGQTSKWINGVGSASMASWTFAQFIDFVNSWFTFIRWTYSKWKGDSQASMPWAELALGGKTLFTVIGGTWVTFALATSTTRAGGLVEVGIAFGLAIFGSVVGGPLVHIVKAKMKKKAENN